MSFWVGNTTLILACHFNSLPGSIMKSELQFPLLHKILDTLPPSKACFYGHINCSLAMAHQQSSLGLSLSSAHVRGARAKPKTGLRFNVPK